MTLSKLSDAFSKKVTAWVISPSIGHSKRLSIYTEILPWPFSLWMSVCPSRNFRHHSCTNLSLMQFPPYTLCRLVNFGSIFLFRLEKPKYSAMLALGSDVNWMCHSYTQARQTLMNEETNRIRRGHREILLYCADACVSSVITLLFRVTGSWKINGPNIFLSRLVYSQQLFTNILMSRGLPNSPGTTMFGVSPLMLTAC